MNAAVELEPGELWRPIADFPRYEVSDRGRVRNVQTNHLLVPHIRRGYHSLIIRDGAGAKRDVRIHRLVAAAFLGPAHGLPVARHLDGNPLNNTAENLAWGTYSDNNFDTVRHGRHHKAIVTRCRYWHPFDETNTGATPQGNRFCRACQNIRSGWRQAAKKAGRTGAREVRFVSRDVQYLILGGTDVRAELLLSIDRVARELDEEPGWRIQVEIDPGTVITATPARETDRLTQRTGAPERPSEAPLTPEDGEDG